MIIRYKGGEYNDTFLYELKHKNFSVYDKKGSLDQNGVLRVACPQSNYVRNNETLILIIKWDDNKEIIELKAD